MKTSFLLVFLCLLASASWAGPSEEACAKSLDQTVEMYKLTGGSKDLKTAAMLGSLMEITREGLKDMRAQQRVKIEAQKTELESLENDALRQFGEAQPKVSVPEKLADAFNLTRNEAESMLEDLAKLERLELSAYHFRSSPPAGADEVQYWAERIPREYRHQLATNNAMGIKNNIDMDISALKGKIKTNLENKHTGHTIHDLRVEWASVTKSVRSQTATMEEESIKMFVRDRLPLVHDIRAANAADDILYEKGLMKQVAESLPTSMQQKTLGSELDSLKAEVVELEADIQKDSRTLINKTGSNLKEVEDGIQVKLERFAAKNAILEEGVKMERLGWSVKTLLESTEHSNLQFHLLGKYLKFAKPVWNKLLRGGLPIAGIMGYVAFEGYFAEGVSAAGISEAFKNSTGQHDPRKMIDMLAQKKMDSKAACLEIGRLPPIFTVRLNEEVSYYSGLAKNRKKPTIMPVVVEATFKVKPTNPPPAQRPSKTNT